MAVSPGWRVDVFQDFSAEFAYSATDFVDGSETYSNVPDWLFVLDAPFPQVLGVVAGRRVIELSGTSYLAHDFGQHPPNTAGSPDHLRGATFVPELDGSGPAVLVASASEGAGDGTFRIGPDWSIASDNVQNNTRSVVFDSDGNFDTRPSAEGYLATQAGIFRRSDDLLVAAGDTKTMRLVGSDLLVSRQLASTDQVVRIASGSHTESVLAESRNLRLGDGPPLAPYLAWVIVDDRELALLGANGQLTRVLATADADYKWLSVTAPASPHPLAGRVFLLENNRGLDLDRVLAIAQD